MLQYIHDVGAVDARRVIKPGLVVAAIIEIGNARLGELDHVLLGAERDRLRRAGFGTGRLKADRDAVGAQRAFVGFLILLGDARDVERAPFDAIAAADAVLRDEVNDSVRVLDNRTRRRAGFEAAGIGAMHAAVLADQPFEVAVLFDLGEAHQGPAVLGQVGRIIVDPDIDPDLVAQIVPLVASRLTGLAADAFRDVDQFRDRFGLTHARRWARGGRAAGDVEGLQSWHRGRSLNRRCRSFDIDQKRLVFRRLDVRVADIGGQDVGGKTLLGLTGKAPMDRDANGVDHLAVDLKGTDTLGHHRHRNDLTTIAADLYQVAVIDAFLPGERLANLDELLRL